MARIPKILHQTYSDKSLAAEVAANMKKLIGQNPGWTHAFYDDKDRFDFIRSHYDLRVLTAYNRINPMYGAARADFFRYLLIYKVGGVYIDLKSGASKSLDEITANHQYLLSNWDNGPTGVNPGYGMHFSNLPRGEFQQWHVAAVPGHPFLKAVIDRVLGNIESYTVERFGVGFGGVLHTTGPVPYTLAILPLVNTAEHHYQSTNQQMGFIYNMLTAEHRNLMHTDRRPHYLTLKDPVVL